MRFLTNPRIILTPLLGLLSTVPAAATNFTTQVPGTSLSLPASYPEAGGVAIVMIGANGNSYFQFSDPDGAFIGFQSNGRPAAFRGNPFTINDPLTLNCGFSSCSDYFGGSISEVHIRFSAYDGDTQPGGFDEDDISLRLNGFEVGSWSGLTTEATNTSGTTSFGFGTGFGNRTFDTGWFSSTNPALLGNILSTGQTTTQVYDDDPNDNYWDFTRGNSLADLDNVTVAPGYEIEKTADKTTFAAVGETITYSYVVTNVGSVPISNLQVSDDKISNVTCDKTTIQDTEVPASSGGVADFATCTGTYQITQEDFDAGQVTNIASATGTPSEGSLGELTDTLTITGPAIAPSVELTKSTTLSEFGAAGTTVPYTFVVLNDGDATLTDLVVTDPLIPSLSCTIAELLPNASQSCTANYTVTQDDVDDFATSGTLLANTATVNGTAPQGLTVQDTHAVSIPSQTPVVALELEKTAITADYDEVDDTVQFNIVITNTGTVTYPTAPTVTDVLTDGASCPVGPVAPGASITCVADYDIMQHDIDAGQVLNEASAAITIAGQTVSDLDTATIDAIRTSGLTLDKMLAAASPVNFAAPSVGLTYDYVLTNTGNVTLETPTVSDDLVGVTCSATEIAPNTSITCTSDVYSTKQTDVNDGGVTNIATASANEAGTGTAVPSNQDQVTVPALQSPELTVVKTAPTVLAADFQVGETVTYTFDVSNSGNVDLAGQIEITDDKIGTFDCGVGGLVAGGTVQCTANYILDSDDISAGVVVNVATAASGATTSDQVTATIAPVLTPSISLVKSSTTASVAALTDTIDYVFTVENTGDTQILKSTQPISINDSLLAGVADCSAQPATLNPNETFDCTATFSSLDQDDLDAGSISNTATASFDFSQGGVTVTIESDASTAVVPVVQNVDFTLDKSGPLTFGALNESLSYSFDLVNTGNVTIETLSVSDPLIPTLACTFTDVAPGATETCTGTYAVDQDDIDAESIVNLATATAETALNADVVKTDTHTATSIPAAQTKSVALNKTADLSPFTAVGEVITYTLAIESTGLQTLTDVVVTDILDPSYSCTIPTLAPNEISSICTFAYTVTQDDIDAGSIANTATASSPEITSATANLTIPGPARTASYEFTKSHDVDFAVKDDVVTFGFAVENTGTTTLTNVVITDPFFGAPVTCTIPTILPGATDTSCSAAYSVTQADVDAGSITNTASVTVDAPAGVGDPLDQTSTVVVDGPAETASIEIVKAAADGAYDNLPDSEVFTFTVTNTGNVTLTGLVVTDADLGFSCALDDLAPNASTTQCTGGAALTATKTITQADIDLGSYTNSVSVVGASAVNGTGVSDEDIVTISGPAQLPAISMTKTETLGTTFDTVGQTVPYTFTITNTGNITLTGSFTVEDDKIASVVCPATPSAGIAIGGQLVCTGEHIVTQADLDAGFITNKAEATTVQPVIPTTLGGASIATVVSGEEIETILANQTPALALDKHVLSTSPSSYAAVGDVVTFEYVVTNTGNVTTTADITILDNKIPGTHTCSATLIAPNDTVTCTIDWIADQSAIDDGQVTNTATANTIFDSSPVQSAVDTATVTAVQTPSLVVEKTFTGTNNVGFFNENDILTYDITVTNNGNVTLTAPFSLDDNLVAPVCASVPATLAPTQSYDCTATYSVTQNDLDLGAATNVITATGTFGGDDVVSPSDNAIYPVDADPALFLTKTVVSGADFSEVGDIITYDFTVTNQGNVGLSDDIYINDLLLSSTPILCRDATAIGSALPAGAGAASSYTCQQTYPVTQDDLDAGEIVNNATAETVYAPLTVSTNVVSPNATATVDADDTPALTVAKIVTSGDNPANLDDLLTYQITVTNSGNQTLSGVTVSDPLIPALTCTVGGAAAPANVVLAPDAAMICTGTYTVTQDDLDKTPADGSNSVLSNTANARGSDPQGDTVTGMGSNDHPLDDPAPAVSLVKTITPEPGPDDAFSTVGQPVAFVLAVTNDGNVTLESTVVTDNRTTTPASCTLGPIAPGETDSSCVVEYIITQDDFDVVNNTGSSDFAGFTNTGTATSTPANPDASDVSATGDVFVRGPEHEPLFALVKDADKETFSTFGETITYTYTVANIGNITLFATPSIEDDKIGTFACGTIPAGGLAPEEFLTCTATYNVKQEDLDFGSVTNIAKVTSTEVTTPAEATETVDAVQMPNIAITKTPSITSDAAAGNVIEYTYTVENTGNVTLTDVTLEDTQTHAGGTTALAIGGDVLTTDANETGTSPDGQGLGVWGTLSTSDIVTFTASYTVTQADVDAQVTLTNTASVTGTGPTGTTPPEDEVTVTVPTIAKAPSIDIRKTAEDSGVATPAALGQIVTFEIEIENTGNQTLTDVELTDVFVDDAGGTLSLTGPNKKISTDTVEVGVLNVGETWVYEASYTLTQDAIDAGGIENTASVTAKDPQLVTVDDAIDALVEVDITRDIDLAVVKTAVITDTVAGTDGVIDAGDTITYTYVVHNTGNTTLFDVGVAETTFTGTGAAPVPLHASGGVDLGGDGTIKDLAFGTDTVTFTATYTLTQDDIDAGFVDNQATASATGPDGSTPTDTSDESGTADGDDDPTKAIITRLASLDVVKTVDDSALSSPVMVGDSVVFTITAENTGNVTLDTVTLDDTFTRRDGTVLTLTPTISNAGTATNNGDATLDVGEIWAYSATYNLTQDDIDAGGISNTIEIIAETPDDSSISDVSDNGDDTDGNTEDDPAALNILGEPDLTLSKTLLSGANPYSALTDTLTYQFVVTNTGNITITAPVTISDPLITDAGGLITCSAPPVAPNGTFTCTGSYDVTQADLDADNITNTATANVTQPLVPFVDGGPTSAALETPEDGVIVPSDQRPALTISKIIDPDSPTTFAAIGDQVTFVYTVTNTGNVTTTAPITVTDDQIPNGGVLPGVHACSSDLIAPSETVTCELVWTADQDALDAGEVTNTATAETTFDGAAVVTADPATATVTAIQTKELSLTKTLRTAVPDLFDENTVLTYDFVVKNEGNVSIDGPIEVNDLLIDTVTCTQPVSGKLAPQGTVACTATYTLSANDIALGSTVNVASATGTFGGVEVTSPTDNAIYPVNGKPSLALVKDSIPSDTSFDTLGEIIKYTYTVTNDGKAGFTGDVFVNDNKIDDPILCHPATDGTFNVGQSATCKAEYRVTQEDLDAGFVTNEATANSIFAPGTTNEIPVSSIAALKTVTSIKDAALTVVKIVSDGPSEAAVGDSIEYTITTTNTGNQTIAGVTVTDPLIPVLACTVDGASAPANVVLAPSESLVCVGTYEVDQDDIDTQTLSNTATARGADPQGGNVFDEGTALQALVDDNPVIDVTKALLANTGTGPAFTAPGETIQFVITVENKGNVTLNSTTITDDLLVTPASCEIGVLAPGATDSSCIVSYVTTQDDINAVNTEGGVNFGGFTNTATAVSLPATPNATPVTDDGAVFVRGPDHAPSFDILKEADVSVISAYDDEITYTYTITNSGNITLFDQPVVSDDKIETVTCSPIAATGMLPNDTLTCTATYNATQADIDAGFVTNIASVASPEVPLPVIPGDAETSLTIPATRSPAIEITKVADTPTDVEVDDVVTYTYTVTNTGNVTLTNIALDDQHTTVAGTVTQSIAGDALDTDADEQGNSVDAAENGGWDTLGPNDAVTFTSTYTVTQADIDAQTLISNTVVVTSESPSGTIAPTDSATETVTSEEGEPELTVLKSADTTGLSTPPKAGDVISFEISVENTGNQSLDNIALTDTFVQTDGTVLSLTNGPTFTGGDAGVMGTIEVGETWTYAADYTLTQDDINAGGVSNSVLVTSDSPDDTNVEDISDVEPEAEGEDDPTVVQFPSMPRISGAKTVTSTTVEVGGIVTFEITAQNTGNVTLTDVAVASDTLTRVDGTALELTSQPVFRGASLGSGAGTLEPTETATYLATYILTQDDVDAGGIINTATVTGTPPIGSPVTDITDSGQDGDAATTDEVTVLDIPAVPSISLDKRLAVGQNQTYSVLNEAVRFEFEITNTGNVTLDGPFSVADPLIAAQGGSVSCGLGALAPDESVVCEGVYNVTQDDLDFGSFDNAATATDGTVTADDVVNVPALQLPEMTIDKVAEAVPAASFVIGAQVTYTYTVTNVGNVTISEPVTVNDNLIAANDITCPAFPDGGIAPNGTYICEGVYTVTSTDVDLQAVTNLASATDGVTTTPLTSETIPDAGVPSLSITKTAEAGATFAEVGDEIDYTFVVTNTGTQSFVRPIVVHDDKLGEIVCLTPSDTDDFRPTETATCTGTHIVTQDDLDAGEVVNEAYALTSFGLTDTPVASAPVTEAVDAELTPALSLDKTVTSPAVTAVGQVIEYTLTATNAGNQTLTNVVIEDPKLAGFSCAIPTLLRDESLSCTGTYTVTQDDVDLGTFTNTASTFGITPQGVALDPTEDSVTSQMPAVTGDVVLTKTSTPSPFGAVGSTLTYLFAVENQSNVTVEGLTVTDVMDPSFACEIASIAPGATDNTCSYAITVTQDHVDAGEIENTGAVTGVDARGNTVGDVDTIVTAGPERLGSIEVTKIILPSASAVGSLVTYQLLVENTGNVTVDVDTPVDTMSRLNGVSVTLDAPFALDMTTDTDSDGRLDVGEIWSYTATYTLSQPDLNAGGLLNVVSVSGIGAGGDPVGDTSDDGIDNDGNTLDDPTIFEIAQDPELTVTKTIASSEGIEAGDTVVFEIEALNTGNVDLTDLGMVDTLRNMTGAALMPETPVEVDVPDTLSPGATATWTVAYTLTQDDVDAGGIFNSATVSGLDPDNIPVSDVSADGDTGDGNLTDDPTVLAIAPAPAMEVIKQITDLPIDAGEDAVFTITVKNTGSVTLSDIELVDTMTNFDGDVVGPVTLAFVTGQQSTVEGVLQIQETATYTATYTLTQEDVDSGGITNTVTATAETPLGAILTDVSDDDGAGIDDPTVAPITAAPDFELIKTASDPFPLFPTVDQVTFTITVENTGNITQTGIQVVDDLAAFVAPATLLAEAYPVEVRVSDFTDGTANAAYDGVDVTETLAGNATLAPGEIGTIEIVTVYSTATGQPAQANVGSVVSDQLGEARTGTAEVAFIDSDGDGAPDYLESSTEDRDGDGIVDSEDYDPTGYFYCEENGQILSGGSISVSGGGFTQTGVGTSGPIVIVQDGTSGYFQFFVTSAGSYTLGITYPPAGSASVDHTSLGTIDATSLLPDNPVSLGSNEFGSTGVLSDYAPASNPFYTTFDIEAGDPSILNNNIPLRNCAAVTNVLATKTADRTSAVFGDTVNFTLTYTNNTSLTYADAAFIDLLPEGMIYTPGSARVDGAAVEPIVEGRRLVWTGDLAPAQTLTINLSARVAANGTYGVLTNRSWVEASDGAQISNTATAEVSIEPEHVFDCTDVIGKVFDDRNGNGYQDGAGSDTALIIDQDAWVGGKFATPEVVNTTEPGLPGVRLVAPDGTTITTDEYGRYSVPCAALPASIGSNFILKLDTRSLPTGYRVTTENPRVERLTAGKFAKMNFGATAANVVSIDLTAAAFDRNTTVPSAALVAALDGMLTRIKETPSTLRLSYLRQAHETPETAQARLNAVETSIKQLWRGRGNYKLIIEKIIVRAR